MEVREYTPGQQLPGTVYRVVRHLATGGMGSVYDVEDITVGKRYVLKTLHPQLVNRKDLAKRMEAEARALAKLQHPNIVDVFTAGVTSDAAKMPFYVMERLNGQNLRVVIEKKGALEITHAYRIATDVLDALEQAHENGIIHRDVKPENIFLHRNVNGTTITKLLDFGIMRLLDKKASHTQGKFIGTLRYASPEQIFGGELGPTSDIYSLGVVLYEMLAGRGPFDELSDAYAIGAAHAQRPPPPLTTFVRVPLALERLVMSALGKTPADRPRDCFTFASELRRLLREEESAPPKSATEIALVSAAPPTRGDDAYAGTEASSPPPMRISGFPPNQTPPNQAPAQRIPSNYPPPTGGIPSTRRDAPPPAARMALAATVASQPDAYLPTGPGAQADRPSIDRAAETRASAPQGSTMRLAGQNGTSVEEPVVDRFDPAAHEAVVGRARVATGPQPAAPTPVMDVRGGSPGMGAVAAISSPPAAPPGSLRPPTSVGPAVAHDTGGDLRFPPQRREHTGSTGPLVGEASTRPPERTGMLGPLIGAGFAGALIVGIAVFVVALRPDFMRPGGPAAPPSGAAVAPPPPPTTAPPASPAAAVSATPSASAKPAAPPTPAIEPTLAMPPKPGIGRGPVRAPTTRGIPEPKPQETQAPPVTPSAPAPPVTPQKPAHTEPGTAPLPSQIPM